MSEEFESVHVDGVAPVAESSAPVGSGTDEPVVTTEDVDINSSGALSEQPDADQKVFDNTPKVGSAEDNIKQDVAAENGIALGNGGGEGYAAVTARGQEEADNKKQEARDALIDQMEQAEASRKEKEENFGMSLKDLVKMLDFIANPELQAKLKDRLTSSIGEKRAEKAMAELNELHQLKKKQEKGVALSPEECARLDQLKKSEDLKLAVQQAQDIRTEVKNGLSQQVTNENAERIGAIERGVSESAGRMDFRDNPKGAEGAQQTAFFQSSSEVCVRADGISPQTVFNACAVGKEVNKAPTAPPAAIMAVAKVNPDSLGFS